MSTNLIRGQFLVPARSPVCQVHAAAWISEHTHFTIDEGK